MNRITKGLAITSGLVVLAAAATHALAVAPNAKPVVLAPIVEEATLAGPDVIVGSIYELRRWTTSGGQASYSIGTESCNIGTVPLLWQSNNNNHPVIGQNFYRLKDDSFEQVGMSWLKHGFAALTLNLCGQCQNPGSSQLLGVNCSDPYSASLNGSQSNLGPRYEVNPYTGFYPYPFTNPSAGNSLNKRIICDTADVDPAQNAGALYFAEGHYITADDAAAGAGVNNASYRRIQFNTSFTPSFVAGQSTQRQSPAVFAWRDVDPSVQISKVDLGPDDGVIYVGSHAKDLGGGQWQYTYAVQVLNNNRGVRGFGVEIPGGVTPSGYEDNIPEYQPLDPYINANWKKGSKLGYRFWACKSITQEPNANRLTWGTVGTFRLIADSPPTTSANLGVEWFLPGTPKRTFFTGIGPS
jgi:hypothetical protein